MAWLDKQRSQRPKEYMYAAHVPNDPDPSRAYDNSLPREMHTPGLWMKANLLCIVSHTYEWGRPLSIVHMHTSLPLTMECTTPPHMLIFSYVPHSALHTNTVCIYTTVPY